MLSSKQRSSRGLRISLDSLCRFLGVSTRLGYAAHLIYDYEV